MKSVLVKNQKKTLSRMFTEDGINYNLTVSLQYDDACGNGHNTFAMTGEIREVGKRFDRCGCLHDEIARVFPELQHLIEWHLCSSDGPIHYVANTVYHASDKDCWGKRKGEPTGSEFAAYWCKSPFPLSLDSRAAKRLGKRIERHGRHRPEIHQVAHKNDSELSYKFADKFTFDPSDKWHECPFDTYDMAARIQTALFFGRLSVKETPTGCSEGKEPDLLAARRSAIWPDATDEDLLGDDLEAKLTARLPALLVKFQELMENLGFQY